MPGQEEGRRALALAQAGDLPGLQAELQRYQEASSDDSLANLLGGTGESLLAAAARAEKADPLAWLLTLPGLHLEHRNTDGKTALHEAAGAGRVQAVAALLEAGAEVDSLKRGDWTPLMLAATRPGQAECVSLLLRARADPTLTNKDGWSALQVAVRAGDRACVAALLAAAPDTALATSKTGRTVLHTAALAGQAAVLELLLARPALQQLVGSQDRCGSRPLHDAARAACPDCVRLLLAVPQCNPAVRDLQGITALGAAAEAGAVAVLPLLLSGAGPALGPALRAAARAGQAGVVAELLTAGSPPDVADERGRTALWLASNGQHSAVCRLLLQAGADPAGRDTAGTAVMDIARRDSLVLLLQQYVQTK